ncbi:MAG: MBL fold metallo-hydrolase [Desulfotignum sp.]|jgi:7,8-dihydropterin-6-yl-methyl-4-(beta-D-ribofuranosyl)aminobenzene 5'-phosphate synthase|nr:MBL fold metallo-hydrolase [Desulfotignum sp.]
MTHTRITIICENRAHMAKNIMGEHGFAALVKTPGSNLLMDTGQGLGLAHNADVLKLDLAALDGVVISHGHFDHTGGLLQIPAQNRPLPVHAHPDLFTGKYLLPKNQDPTYIGIPFPQSVLEEKLDARFEFHSSFTDIAPGVFFSGQVPRTWSFEPSDDRLVIQTADGFVPDPFKDDASLLIETRSGPVILTGCAHSGIVNIMEHFAQQSGHQTFHAVIGGTHLGFANDPSQLEQAMAAFDRFQVNTIAVSHCTGNEAAALLFHRFKDRFAFAGAGWHMDF